MTVSFSFPDTRVLVTGGTSGTGLAVAGAFAEAGAAVSITGRRSHASEYDVDLSAFDYHQCEMADPAQIAQELIVDNQPERALHLAEVVLTADPAHIGAWTASRDAHRQLLDRAAGENFWETRWLQIQLQKAERKILAAKEH